MTIITCVDNRMGMAFGGRRVSRDGEVTRRVAELAAQRGLRANAHTARLFERYSDTSFLRVSDEFLSGAGPDDICFAENTDVAPFADRVDRIVLFRWNRDYPSDLKLTLLEDGEWELERGEEFAGRSHERITMEVFNRCRR